MRLPRVTNRTVLSLFAIVAAVVLATASPATASGYGAPADATVDDDDGVIFSVFGDVGDGVGSTVADGDLAELGIEVIPGNASSAPTTVQFEAAPSAQAAATNNVLFRWNDFGSRKVALRSSPYKPLWTSVRIKETATESSPRTVRESPASAPIS